MTYGNIASADGVAASFGAAVRDAFGTPFSVELLPVKFVLELSKVHWT